MNKSTGWKPKFRSYAAAGSPLKDTPKGKNWKEKLSRSPRPKRNSFAFTDFSNVYREGLINISNSASKHEILTDSQKRWASIRNLVSALRYFRQKQVNEIKGEFDLEEAIRNYCLTIKEKLPGETAERSLYKKEAQRLAKEDKYEALIEQHNKALFFDSIRRANEEDLEIIRKTIVEDPKRFILRSDHPDRLVNKADILGERPLYIAARDGNMLIRFGDQILDEGVLAVAARWDHSKVLDYFINEVTWTKKELKEALEVCTNSKFTLKLENQLKKYRNSIIDFFLCRNSKKLIEGKTVTTENRGEKL